MRLPVHLYSMDLSYDLLIQKRSVCTVKSALGRTYVSEYHFPFSQSISNVNSITIAKSFRPFLILLQLCSNIATFFKLAQGLRFTLLTISWKSLIAGNGFSRRKGNFHHEDGVYPREFRQTSTVLQSPWPVRPSAKPLLLWRGTRIPEITNRATPWDHDHEICLADLTSPSFVYIGERGSGG